MPAHWLISYTGFCCKTVYIVVHRIYTEYKMSVAPNEPKRSIEMIKCHLCSAYIFDICME